MARLASALSLYVAVGGLTSFIGWAADIPHLTDWDNHGISIQPNATIAAAAAGAALLALIRGYRLTSAGLGALVAVIGATTLFQWVSGVSLGTDTLLMFGRSWGRGGVIFPGRMGPPGAASWTLIGCAIVLAAFSQHGRLRLPAVVPALALVTATISSLSLIGYLYAANVLYAIPTATVIAFQTSTFILAASVGLMLIVPEHGLLRLLREHSPAGVLVRRILPAVIAVPILLGLLRLAGERAGLYDVTFGTAARTLLEIGLLLALLWWTANAISRQTKAREQAEQAVEASEQRNREQLEADLADSALLQRISAQIIHENDVQSLYEQIIDSAMLITRAQYGSMQMLHSDPEAGTTGTLRMLAFRGFSEQAATFWESVSPASHSTCGQALSTGERVVVPDVLACSFMAGTADLGAYRETGIQAVQSTPLLSRSGKVLGMLSTHWRQSHAPSDRELRLLDILARQAADLIERRQSEEALRHADRRKDEFLTTLAHELRNPLAPVRSAIELMKRKPSADHELTRARDVIDRQTSLMARLLDDLMDVGRIVRDRLELRPERVDLGSLVRSTIEISGPLVERFNHELHLSLPSHPLYLYADPARLGQIIGNLLNNACRYTEPNGHIWIAVDQKGPDVTVTVRDTGIGIPPTKLSSIFDMFSQVDSSLERSQGGLGIGLHLVKRLAEMHGGGVEATSDGLGRGSTFTLRLPIAQTTDVEAAERLETHDSQMIASALRILVVDDNLDSAEMMATLLEVNRHQIRLAHDGPSAFASAESFLPEVILLDIGLPQMNGFDVCRRIREQSWGRGMVLIALTGWGQESDRQRSRDAGFDHHIVKPVEQAVLLRLLSAVPARMATGTRPLFRAVE